jgi:hypothetical protein
LAYLFPEDRYEHPDPPRSPTPIDSFHPPTPPMSADKVLPVLTLGELPSPTLTHDPSSPTLPETAPVSPGPVGIDPSHPIWIFDSSLREVDFDVTCLNALDEQLLHSPKDCFLDICWAEAVYDEVEVPVLRVPTPEKLRVVQSQKAKKDDSFTRCPDPILMPTERKSVSVLRCFPVVTTPDDGIKSPLSSPQSYTALSPHRTVLQQSESRMLYQNANHSVHFFPTPQHRDPRSKLCESHAAEDPPDTRSRKSSGKLKIFTDTYDTLTGRRRTTSHA